MKNKIATLFIGLITTIVGVILGWYLSNVYQQPKILWYSRPYYKLEDVAIGNIFLWNAGRKVDHNIAITLDAKIEKENIKIVDLTSPYEIKYNDNKTIILIQELKPDESADITFKDDPNKDDVYITDFTSEHSRIINIPMTGELKWWYLPIWWNLIIGIIIFVIGGLSGYLLNKSKFHKVN